MMQGLIKSLLGNSLQARELRKRCVFKIIPMTNPDGVIVGNYRTNLAGNDLNRKYHNPDPKLHPTVYAIKNLVASLSQSSTQSEEDKVFAFIDMHAHSRKKNVFIYGPYYPLHHDSYFKMRILPKLLSEETTKFRYFSCKFRIERSKEKAARIVLWREFNISNCFTFEASFHGYLNEQRVTEEFNAESLESMGEHLVNALYENFLILEEEDRQKKLRELNKKKKKKQPLDGVQQMSQTTNESFGGKQRKQSVNSLSSQPLQTVSLLVKQNSKKVTPRVQLVHIEEERDEEEYGGLNPNEPPDTPKKKVKKSLANQRQVSQSLEANKVSSLNKGGGIRSIKEMFKLLKRDEKKRHECIDEEDGQSEENKDVSEEEGGDNGKQDSGSDSDPQDGELTTREQEQLYSNIKGTIDQFESYFNTGVVAKRGKLRLKQKKQVKEKRNVKSPLPTREQSSPSKDLQKKTKSDLETLNQVVIQQPMIIQTKPKKTFQQMAEEQKLMKDSSGQKAKIQAVIPHTNIEFFSKQTLSTKVPQYSSLKQAQYAISSFSQQPINRDPRLKHRISYNNPLIINKIRTDFNESEYNNSIFNRFPQSSTLRDIQYEKQVQSQKQAISSLTRSHFGIQDGISIFQGINMVGGLSIAGSNHTSSITPHESSKSRHSVINIQDQFSALKKQCLQPHIGSSFQSAIDNSKGLKLNYRLNKNQTPLIQQQQELSSQSKKQYTNLPQDTSKQCNGFSTSHSKQPSNHDINNISIQIEEIYNIKARPQRTQKVKKVPPIDSTLPQISLSDINDLKKQIPSPKNRDKADIQNSSFRDFESTLLIIAPPSTAGSQNVEHNTSKNNRSMVEKRKSNYALNGLAGQQVFEQGEIPGRKRQKVLAQQLNNFQMSQQEFFQQNQYLPDQQQVQNVQKYKNLSDTYLDANKSDSGQNYLKKVNNTQNNSINIFKYKPHRGTLPLENLTPKPMNVTPKVLGQLIIGPTFAHQSNNVVEAESKEEKRQSKLMNQTIDAPKLTVMASGFNSITIGGVNDLYQKKLKSKEKKSRVFMNGNQQLIDKRITDQTSSKEHILKASRSKYFEEIVLPYPNVKKRTSRTNNSFHDSKGHESYTQNNIAFKRLNDSSAAMSVINLTDNKNKYQNIIDTMLQDSYPVSISMLTYSERHSSKTKIQ